MNISTHPLFAELDLGPDLLSLLLTSEGKVLHCNQAYVNHFSQGETSSSLKESLGRQSFEDLIEDLQELKNKRDLSKILNLEHTTIGTGKKTVRWQFFLGDNEQVGYKAIGTVVQAKLANKSVPSHVLDYVTDCLFAIDSKGNFMTVNQGFVNFVSKPKEELLQLDIDSIFGSKESPTFSLELNRLLHKCKPDKLEVFFPTLRQWWFFAIYPSPEQINVYSKNITQRKQYELGLKESQTKLKAILDSTSEINVLVDLNYKVLSFNKSASLWAQRILRKTLVEGTSILGLLSVSDQNAIKEIYEQALLGNTIKYERSFHLSTDEEHWFRISFVPVYCDKNKVNGVAINAENIGEAKEAESVLNMHSLIASHVTDAVVVTNQKGETIWVNESFVRKTGFTLEDMKGLKPGEVLQGAASDPEVVRQMSQAVAQGKGFDVELINYTKSGKPFHVEIKSDPYYNPQGELQGFIAVQPDITERKRLEEVKLRKSWKRYHAIFENSINAILLANNLGEFIDANAAASEMSGYSLEELRSMNLGDVVDNNSDMTHTDDWNTFIAQGKMEGTVALKTKNGELKVLDFRAVADILPGIHLSVLSDITDHFESEQLIIDQKRHLETLNEEKSRLFSIIAHDLRSPLNSLSGMINLIQNEYIEKSLFDEQIKIISERITHSVNLMDNLFQWAQHQLGGIRAKFDRFDLYEIGKNKIELFKRIAANKKITINNQFEKGTFISADINMTDLVIRNLVANAIKFCREGGEVKMTAEHMPNLVKICVTDNGVGIKEEHLENIFGSMMTTVGTKEEKGSGLGLRICKEFVEKQGGRIWVESKLGEGSNFCLIIPQTSDF